MKEKIEGQGNCRKWDKTKEGGTDAKKNVFG
jgi:hypothetical protein